MKAISQRFSWRPVIAASLFVIATASVCQAQAQVFPDKPVQIITDTAIGTAPDVGLRLVADELTKLWGQQVAVINRPGAGGSLGARAAASASPDGYTLYQAAMSTFLALHSSAPNIPVRVPRDFLSVGIVTEIPIFFAVSSSLGVSSLPELIARAKQRPGKISYAITGVGRMPHLAGEMLQLQAGIKLQEVPYSGGAAQAFGDIASGRVEMIVEGYSAIAGATQSGSLKLIAVALDKRLPAFPDVPTVAETIPGFRATGWASMLAPLGTPQWIIDKVSADLQKVVSKPDLQEKLAAIGSGVNPMSATDTATFINKQQEVWSPVLKALGDAQKP